MVNAGWRASKPGSGTASSKEFSKYVEAKQYIIGELLRRSEDETMSAAYRTTINAVIRHILNTYAGHYSVEVDGFIYWINQ